MNVSSQSFRSFNLRPQILCTLSGHVRHLVSFLILFLILALAPKSLLLSFGGPEYPMNVTLFCDKEETDPKFVSYDGQQLAVEWTTPDACPLSDGDGDKPEDSKPGSGGNENPTSGRVGSGIGWFFLMYVSNSRKVPNHRPIPPFSRLLFAFAAYFAIGAYYNYSTYGARGLDLIPYVNVAMVLYHYVDAPFADIVISGKRCHTCSAT